MNLKAQARTAGILGGMLVLSLSFAAQSQGDEYPGVADDLGNGMSLEEVAKNAYQNAQKSDQDAADKRSAGQAVAAIYELSSKSGNAAAPNILNVAMAVIDAWPDCQDTFDAVRAAVELEPAMAAEIIANISVKRDCNCSNGGLWLDQRVMDRVRVEQRETTLDAPFECSCSQVALYAGVAGLPENAAWSDDLPEGQKAMLIAGMADKVAAITGRTAELQSMNGWECGCTDVNIAASMQGIGNAGFRDGAYGGLAEKYGGGAETGQNCLAESYEYVSSYPAMPLIRYPDPGPNKIGRSRPEGDEVASPN